MLALVVTLFNKLRDLSLQRARQIVIHEQDAVLRGLVPAFDLALRLSVHSPPMRRSGNLAPRKPAGQRYSHRFFAKFIRAACAQR